MQMTINFSVPQLKLLLNIATDVTKALFIASISAPIISNSLEIFISLRLAINALFLLYFILYLVELIEEKEVYYDSI